MVATFAVLAMTLAASAAADSPPPCNSASECNRLGTQAYQAGRLAEASTMFARQIDFAETAQQESGDDDAAGRKARDVALNNAALAQLQAGECRKAAAYLGLADAQSRATQANQRQIQKRCAERALPDSPIGDYWQYAGHGAWNTITLRPTGDETLSLDAFWMRISRGPLDDYGLAAFGELSEVAVFVDGASGTGRFAGIDDAIECTLGLNFEPEHLDINVSEQPECAVGGAGAILSGRYQRVSLLPMAPTPDKE